LYAREEKDENYTLWDISPDGRAYLFPSVGPRIVIEEKSFDAKEVKEGEVIEHTFIVNNKGEEVLEIRKVSPG
jgi:hypothetical protein